MKSKTYGNSCKVITMQWERLELCKLCVCVWCVLVRLRPTILWMKHNQGGKGEWKELNKKRDSEHLTCQSIYAQYRLTKQTHSHHSHKTKKKKKIIQITLTQCNHGNSYAHHQYMRFSLASLRAVMYCVRKQRREQMEHNNCNVEAQVCASERPVRLVREYEHASHKLWSKTTYNNNNEKTPKHTSPTNCVSPGLHISQFEWSFVCALV